MRARLDQRTEWTCVSKLTHVIFQFDALERDAFDILQLIRSWKNRLAPINRIPPEILALVPDFWGVRNRDENIITVTHVCRAWREVFVSRPTLWTGLSCVDLDKTRVYLERSKSSPINLSLDGNYVTLSNALFELISNATGRLKSVTIVLEPEDLQLISACLSRPAPLLEVLSVDGYDDSVLSSALFGGDLSSLRELHLACVRTELPWRNMVNLTSFTLNNASPISVIRFLDFFENAPHLREVDILSTPISDAQDGRLVPLTCLQRMDAGHHPSSSLFDHLLIPVGACLAMSVDLPDPPIKDCPPRFIDNLKNLSNVTAIILDGGMSFIRFSGPSGKVRMDTQSHSTWVHLLLESLAHFDTSNTERLEITQYHSPLTSDPVYRALLPMKALHTLKLDRCGDPHIFIYALDPGMGSSGAVVCPNLEELVIVHGVVFDLKDVVATAAARASRGAKLKSVKIDSCHKAVYSQSDVLELKKHVLHVECGP